MASTRLTISIKEVLTDRLIEHAFTARSRQQLAAECELTRLIYDQVVDTKEIRINGGSGKKVTFRAALAMLPAGWASVHDRFMCRIGGDMVRFDFYSGIEETYRQNSELVGLEKVRMADKKKFLFTPGFTQSTTFAVFEARDAVSIRIEELKRSRSDLVEEIRAARHSARATMDSVPSIQKLIQVWPEVEAFAAPFMQQETAAAAILPVVARERLNDVLGLPPGARA